LGRRDGREVAVEHGQVGATARRRAAQLALCERGVCRIAGETSQGLPDRELLARPVALRWTAFEVTGGDRGVDAEQRVRILDREVRSESEASARVEEPTPGVCAL